jgi:site-specific recombinase XerD
MSAVVAALLDAAENAQREALLRERGTMPAAMRAIERRAWKPAQWLAELWRWLLWLRVSRGLSPATCAVYLRAMLGYAEWIDSRALDYADVRLAELDAWQQHLYMARRNVVGVRARSLYAVRSFYDWRKTRGLGRNCTEGFRAPRLTKRTARKYTKEQLRRLFAVVRDSKFALTAQRDEMLLMLLYATGLRREEVAGLRLDQIEIENNVAVVRVMGKGAKEREIPMEGPVVRMLQQWIAKRGELSGVRTDALFFSTRRNYFGYAIGPRAVETIVRTAAKRAGLGEWGVHRFRVTFATQLYDDGEDIERIRILLGHENIETTRTYIAVSRRMRRVRLKSIRQHEVLGTRPDGMPLWAKRQIDGEKNE